MGLINVPQLTVSELQQILAEGEPVLLLDVREAEERQISCFEDDLHIPIEEIPDRIDELDPHARTIVYCRAGVRSEHVARFLMSQGFSDVSNLAGGINDWAREIDPTMPVY